ncbi:MAG: radical SAM protein [Clostridia bacterium]|nr:radical SAM protein [Clostridia bacterium]
MLNSMKWSVGNLILDHMFKYIDKDPRGNLSKLISRAGKIGGKVYPKENFDKASAVVADENNVWSKFALNLLKDIDREYLKKFFLSFGVGTGMGGTKTARASREKYKCNIPWIILMDPTSACNKKCKGCWSAEYGHKLSLSYDEMNNVIDQAVELGTHFYMFTGGEPLIRKDDIIKLCEAHKDCTFLAYTNATLVDQTFCDEMKRAGNISLAISIEGTKESNDARRGEGSYDEAVKAMELLKKNGLLFGISVCYTSENLEFVTSDEFLDKMVDCGVKFALYFNYMPLGSGADVNLIPSPEQRAYMYRWLRKVRNGETGKPLFVMDFQDDGEYVGGCIAGGRRYFHINSAGDIEPCVFIHYSDSNIRTHTLLEALQNPLFKAYYHNQPFNENHLRPCPMLENPDCLRHIIKETGAKSTDLVNLEDVETLCSKCDKFAEHWRPVADELWNSTTHPKPKTQYYKEIEKG